MIKNKLTVKAIFIMVVLILIIGLLVSSIVAYVQLSRHSIDKLLDNLTEETNNIPAYNYYDKLYLNGNCYTYHGKQFPRHIFSIINENVFYLNVEYSNAEEIWEIVTYNLLDKKDTVCYRIGFGKRDYSMTFNSDSNCEYSARNGYYYDGKIILTNFKKLIEYTINDGSVLEYDYSKYSFPNLSIKHTIIDSQKIVFERNGIIKTLTLDILIEQSEALEKIYTVKNRNADAFSYFFSNHIYYINDKIYIVGSLLNNAGEGYAVMMEYIFEENSCKYIDSQFVGDLAEIGSLYNVIYSYNDRPLEDQVIKEAYVK